MMEAKIPIPAVNSREACGLEAVIFDVASILKLLGPAHIYSWYQEAHLTPSDHLRLE